jgi:hypothetical protein
MIIIVIRPGLKFSRKAIRHLVDEWLAVGGAGGWSSRGRIPILFVL